MTSVRGHIRYLRHGQETGREWFAIGPAADGGRVLRAQCEMDDDRVLRDAVLAVGPDWRPRDAYVRIEKDGAVEGAGWFRFAEGLTEHEGFNRTQGRIHQRFARTCRKFGNHALQSDAWACAQFDHGRPETIQTIEDCATMSRATHGATGPTLNFNALTIAYRGRQRLTVPAGTFDCRQYGLLYSDYTAIETWVTGPACVFVRMEWAPIEAVYELVSLEGNPG